MRSSSEWKLITTSRPPLGEQREALRERALERAELVVERDANRLERARRRMNAALPGGPHAPRRDSASCARRRQRLGVARARTIAAAICRARGSSP